MKKKLFYAGVAATLLFSGLSATIASAASSATDVKKSIEQIRKASSLRVKDSKFDKLDASKIFNRSSKTGYGKLATTNGPIYELEPNDYFDMANPGALETGIWGDLSYNGSREGDFDTFRITITEPGHLYLGAILNRVDYLADLGFALFDSNGNVVYSVDSGTDVGTDVNIDYQIVPVQPGTYYIAAANLEDWASDDQYMLYAEMIDETPPSLPVVNTIDDNDKTISGSAEPNSMVTIKNGSVNFTTVKVNPYGDFAVSLVKPFKAGTKLYFTAKDAAGNVSGATPITVIDKTPPAPPKVNRIDDNDKSITGTAEAYSKIIIKNGSKPFGVANTDKYGNFKFPMKPVKAGSKLYFTATDRYKNVSSTTVVTVADKTAPATLTVNKVKKSSKYVSGKTEAKAYVKVKAGSKKLASGKADSKGYYKLKIKSQKKNTTLTITAKDAAGNSRVVKVKVK